MLSRLIEAVDRLVQLLERQLREKRYAFEEHLDPLFADLSLIHTDYRDAFAAIYAELPDDETATDAGIPPSGESALRSSLASGEQDWSDWRADVQAALRSKKFVLQPLRDKVDALLHALSESRRLAISSDVHDFLRVCGQYLAVGGDTRFHTAISVLCASERLLSRQHVRGYISSVIRELDMTWRSVVAQYAKVRARTLR